MRFELHLTDRENPTLIETVYDKGSGTKPIRCIRTIKDAGPSYKGSFKWSSGTQAFTYFLLKWAAWGRYKNSLLPEPIIKGKKGSLALTLNNFLSRGDIPNRMFGISENFTVFFPIINRDLKVEKNGTVVITIDSDAFKLENIIIIIDREELCDPDEINNIAEHIKETCFPEEVVAKNGKIDKNEVKRHALGNPPPAPELFIGREQDVTNLKSMLGISCTQTKSFSQNKFVVLRGWPGVGKSTFVAAIANNTEVINYFKDGILWTSLGQKPNLLSEMSESLIMTNISICLILLRRLV